MKGTIFIFVIYLLNLIINATGSFRNGPSICTNKQDCAYSRYDAMFPPYSLDRPLKHSRVYKKLLNDREIRTMKNKPQKLPTIEEINIYVNSVHKTKNETGVSDIDLLSIMKRYHLNSKANDHDPKIVDDDYISKSKQIELQKTTDQYVIAKDDDLIAETLFGTTSPRYAYNNSISKPEQLPDDMMNYVTSNPVILPKDNSNSFFHDIQSIKNKYIFSDMTYRKLHMDHIDSEHDDISEEIITPKNEINEHRNDKSEKLYRQPQTNSGIQQIDILDETTTLKYEINEYRNENTKKQYIKNDLEVENNSQDQYSDKSQTTEKSTPIPRKMLEKSRELILNATKKYDLRIMNGRKKYQKDPSENTRSTSKKSKLNHQIDVEYRKHSNNVVNDDAKTENDNPKSTSNEEPEKIKVTLNREQKMTTIPKNTKSDLDFGDLVQTDAPDEDSELNRSSDMRKNGVIDFDLVRKIVSERKYATKYFKKNHKSKKTVTERTDKYENTRPTIDLHYANSIPRRDGKNRMRNIEHRLVKPNYRSDNLHDDYRPQYDLVRKINPKENNAYQREIKQSNKIFNDDIDETKKTLTVKDLRETDTDFLKTIFLKPMDDDDGFDLKPQDGFDLKPQTINN